MTASAGVTSMKTIFPTSPNGPTPGAEGGDNTRMDAPALRTSVAAPSPAATTFVELCQRCRKVKTPEATWRELAEWERQTIEHDGIEVTHGVCPDCARAFRLSLSTNCNSN